MPSPNNQNRLMVNASIQGIEKAEKILIQLNFSSKRRFARAQLVATTAVTNFFSHQPVQIDTFKRICEGLTLDWREILELEPAGETTVSQPEFAIEVAGEEPQQAAEMTSSRNKWTMVQKLSWTGDTPGQLCDVDLSDTNLILAGLIYANMQGADLSGAELLHANMYGANLRCANLSCTNLIYVNLQDANLRDANLSDATLNGVNLSDADLSDADLIGTNLSGSMVRNARFGEGRGLSEEEKRNLASRGAIFDNVSGDRALL